MSQSSFVTEAQLTQFVCSFLSSAPYFLSQAVTNKNENERQTR